MNPDNLPQIRGSIGGNIVYLLAVVPTDYTKIYFCCNLYGEGSAETYSNPVFTPCFTKKDNNFVFDLCEDKNSIEFFSYQNIDYKNTEIDLLEFKISQSTTGYKFSYNTAINSKHKNSGNINISFTTLPEYPNPTGTPSNPDGDKSNILASFPYQNSSSNGSPKTIIPILPRGNEIFSFSQDFSFADIKGDSTDQIIVTDESNYIFFFLPKSYFYQSPQCYQTIFSNSTIPLLYTFVYSIGAQTSKCKPGLLDKNFYCGWTSEDSCATGFFYNYCSNKENCGNCYGQCPSENPCQSKSTIDIKSDSTIGFTCQPPIPPPAPPRPAPSDKETFWKKYGRNVIIASIVAGVLLFLCIFIAWIVPKRGIPPPVYRTVYRDIEKPPLIVKG
jgi:hypothetical protein